MKRHLIKLLVRLRLYRYRCPNTCRMETIYNMPLGGGCDTLLTRGVDDKWWCKNCMAFNHYDTASSLWSESELLNLLEAKR